MSEFKTVMSKFDTESNYKLIKWKSSYYSTSEYSVCEDKNGAKKLFDKNEDTKMVFRGGCDNFIEIEIMDNCNLWTYSEDNKAMNDKILKISKKIDGKYVDVTKKYNQVKTKKSEWTKTIEGLEKGVYKFESTAIGEISYNQWYLEKKIEVYYFLKRQNELLSMNKIYTEKSDNKKFFVVKNIGNESELSKNFISKEDIIKYGVSKIEITNELMEELKECEIIKWVSDEKEDELHIQGEYKDKIFKIFKDGELLLWTDDTDVESATLNGEIEPLNILEKGEEYELLMWTNDINSKDVEISYETEPYRPIDKLDDEFEILKYEITDDDE